MPRAFTRGMFFLRLTPGRDQVEDIDKEVREWGFRRWSLLAVPVSEEPWITHSLESWDLRPSSLLDGPRVINVHDHNGAVRGNHDKGSHFPSLLGEEHAAQGDQMLCWFETEVTY